MSDTPRTEAGRTLLAAYFGNEDNLAGGGIEALVARIEAEAAATSSPAGNGEPLKCSDCGPYAPCPKHDEGTRDAAPGLPCSRYFGSDGTLCATHHGRWMARRCDRATPPSEAPSGDKP